VKKSTSLPDDKLYLFLKFHDGVIKHSNMPYLRNLVALDFLMDKIRVSYGDAELILDWLLAESFIEFDQFGAFPGTIITEKGSDKQASRIENVFFKFYRNEKSPGSGHSILHA
jgi:hypothetical protein